MPQKAVKEILNEHVDEWMVIPGVVGVGTSKHKGKPCILILASKNKKLLKEKIPPQIEGYKILIEEVGEIGALGET